MRQLDDAVPRNFAGGTQDASVAQAAVGSWVCDLSACKERLPRSLKGSMHASPVGPEVIAQAVAARSGLAKLGYGEKLAPRSQCHHFTEDTQQFLEQRIDALLVKNSGQKQCAPYRAPRHSTWHANGTLEVTVPQSISWQLSTLVPLPWATLKALHPLHREAVERRWPQFHFQRQSSQSLRMKRATKGVEVHALELRVSGLDQTQCTVDVEVHARAHRLSQNLLDARAALRRDFHEEPLSIAIVVLDSTPSPAWDVFCPEVMAELAQWQQNPGDTSHEAFRFHGYHALLDPECDCLTQDNMMTFFGGRRVPRTVARNRRVSDSGGEDFREEMGKLHFLWHEMREAGYITLSADDSCSRSPLNVGDPAYDFFDTYAPTFARGPQACTEEVFCRHNELFDYAAQWMDIHADTPRLAYLHLDGTHGTRPESLVRYDADIASWIRGQLHGPGADSTAIVIMSDHGVQAGDGHLTSQPFLAAWLPRKLLRAIGECFTVCFITIGHKDVGQTPSPP